LVARVGDAPANHLALDERPLELDPEPLAELVGVRDRPPDARARGLQRDLLFDPIGVSHLHYATSWLPNVADGGTTCNHSVALTVGLPGEGVPQRFEQHLDRRPDRV